MERRVEHREVVDHAIHRGGQIMILRRWISRTCSEKVFKHHDVSTVSVVLRQENVRGANWHFGCDLAIEARFSHSHALLIHEGAPVFGERCKLHEHRRRHTVIVAAHSQSRPSGRAGVRIYDGDSRHHGTRSVGLDGVRQPVAREISNVEGDRQHATKIRSHD